ncbi:MAG: DUF2333 family protein [Magnetospirillum sp.]|nr:DUF2333 family protein [Magnetospirillum sp.]
MIALSPPVLPSRLRRPPWWLVAMVAVLLALPSWYLIGALVRHSVDDDLAFEPGRVEPGQSRALALAEALIHREVDVHKWVANDPFFQPSFILDNMPNFQMGVLGAVARVTEAIADRDPELARAAGLLKYPGWIWKLDPRASWAPTASAEKQYRNAGRAFARINQRMAAGETVLPRDAATLAAVLGALSADLATTVAEIEAHAIDDEASAFDGQADDVFYAAKGRAYGYALLLRELGWDFSGLISRRDLSVRWRRMLDAVAAVARLDPLLVMNGAPDGLLPNHLAAQGFEIDRARRLLDEVAAEVGE